MMIPCESQPRTPVSAFWGVALAAATLAVPAHAHVSEQAFVLLLPTDLFVTGGILAVAVSVLIISLARPGTTRHLFRPFVVFASGIGAEIRTGLSLLSFGAVCVLVLIGFNGPRDPMANLLPSMVWTGWWIILLSVCGVVGNLWTVLNPWSGLYRLLMGRSSTAGLLPLPERLGFLPAGVTSFAFFAFMIADPAPSDPDRLALVVGVYWALTFLGMILFGGHTWLTRAEGLSVTFAAISKNAVFTWHDDLRAGLPGWQIANGPVMPLSLAVIALMILAGGSFDGLKETFWWLGVVGVNPLEFPGRSAVIGTSIAGLAVFTICLITAFFGACWAGVRLVGLVSDHTGLPSVWRTFCMFAAATLPIALAYHMSHFLVSFLIDGQYLIAILGDPFATGANLFGLADRTVTTGFLSYSTSAQRIWIAQAGIVVAGHVMAVIVSHHMAERLFANTKQVLISQVPVALFMIGYTWFGLWLLASPRGM